MSELKQVKRGFKRKTIIENIETKLNDWFKTLPNDLVDEVKSNVIVTGGAITSMLLGDLPNDYDVYFKTPETAEKVAKHYLSKIKNNNELCSRMETRIEGNRVRIMVKSAGIASELDNNEDYRYFESLPPEEAEKFFKNREYPKKSDNPKYQALYITSNCITLDGDIQIVLRFTGNVDTIHENFDFVHATSHFTYHDLGMHDGPRFKPYLELRPDAMEATLARELKYMGSKYPVCSLFRIKKFLVRGWTITVGEVFKIAYDISRLDLNNIEVLQEQLIGVDQAYWQQLLTLLEEGKSNGKELDRTYIFELVNRVFC